MLKINVSGQRALIFTQIAIEAAAVLDDKYLQTEQALTFGCESDFDAYEMSVNQKPCAEDKRLRSAGAHIHTNCY